MVPNAEHARGQHTTAQAFEARCCHVHGTGGRVDALARLRGGRQVVPMAFVSQNAVNTRSPHS